MPSRRSNSGAPVGTILPYAGSGAAPAGWLFCEGQSLLRADYPALFAAIGETYGHADDTHFNLPDLQARVVVGRKAADGNFPALGCTGGECTCTLCTSDIEAHAHDGVASGVSVTCSTVNVCDVDGGCSVVTGVSVSLETCACTGNAGGGLAHNNLQPYLVLRYMIKAVT